MLDPAARDLAQGRNFAALTTMLPSGHPSTQVMWVDADDDHILINTEVGRQKWINTGKDPRVALAIMDAANPYYYTEVRGRVVEMVTGPQARAHIDKLAQKYVGTPYASQIRTERVILKISAERVRFHEEPPKTFGARENGS
jgi:PPOX class probable F420-dependent enzyme